MKRFFLLSIFCIATSIMFSVIAKTPSKYLTEEEIDAAEMYADDIDDSIRNRFDALHQSWYNAAKNTPEVITSSSTSAWTTLPQFAELKKMGTVIIPLIIEKLTDSECHFTRELYIAVQTDKKLAPQPDDDSLSSQELAARYVKAWLQSQQ